MPPLFLETRSMILPDYLVTQVRDGKVVLFLGAGASRLAKTPSGQQGPTAKELGELIARNFLGGKHVGSPLNQIAEYAISESNLGTVQEFVKSLIDPLEPTAAHLKMGSFIWHGIATTNYERLIEKAYERACTLQTLRLLIENGDRVEDHIREPEDVLLLKLHGCVTRTANPDCPLILTTDQYIDHRLGRDRLFDILRTWGYEHAIIFLGYSLQDPDIRAILSELTKNARDNRPRYYLVTPDVDDIAIHFWDTKKVSALKGSFDEFMASLDAAIPSGFRVLARTIRTAIHPIEQKFRRSGTRLSQAGWQLIETDVDYVNALAATEFVAAGSFYKGFNPGFSAVEQGLDVRRQLGDSILADYFLRDVEDPSSAPEVLLLKAHAGAGKSVLLRRIAWDAARLYDRMCLFLRPHGVISAAAVQELITLCQQRIFLFVDDAADRVRELQSLFKNIGPEGKFVTVVLGERINEWNMRA